MANSPDTISPTLRKQHFLNELQGDLTRVCGLIEALENCTTLCPEDRRAINYPAVDAVLWALGTAVEGIVDRYEEAMQINHIKSDEVAA